MSIAGGIAAALRQEAPYAAEIQMGAQLILDFQGARTGGRPYYWYRGTRYTSPEKIPGWSFSRASEAVAETLSGTLVPFAAGVPAITDRGLSVWEARTNKIACYSANPSEPAGSVGNPVNMTKSGDAASVLSVVSDPAELALAGLAGVCTSGKAYKLDNSAGVTGADVALGGIPGATTAHSTTVYWRGTGNGGLGFNQGGAGGVDEPLALPATYTRVAKANVVASSTGVTTRIRAYAGAVVYFILPQLEEGAFATPPIVTAGSAATRAADNAFITGLGACLAVPFTMQAWAEMNAYSASVQRLVTLSDVSSGADRYTTLRDTVGAVSTGSNAQGFGIGSITIAGKTGARVLKAALRARVAARSWAVDGVLVGSIVDSSTPSGVVRMYLGQLHDGTGHLNNYLRRVGLYGEISDAQLTRLAA